MLELEPKLNVEKDKNNEVKVIIESNVYIKAVKSQLQGLGYLLLLKDYIEDESIRELTSTVMHLSEMICSLSKDFLEKLTATSPSKNSVPLMARPTLQPK